MFRDRSRAVPGVPVVFRAVSILVEGHAKKPLKVSKEGLQVSHSVNLGPETPGYSGLGRQSKGSV